MPFGTGTFQETQPLVVQTTFTSADTTVAKVILAAQNGNCRVDQIIVTSNDTADAKLDLYTHSGANNFNLGSCDVPAGSGFAAVLPVDAMAKAVPTTLVGIALPGNMGLAASFEATLTATKTVTVTVIGGLF